MSSEVSETSDVALCQRIRRIVFIDEQGVTEADEVDGRDGAAIHLIARQDGEPVGTARILLDGATGKIGRVCVLPAARGTGLGAALIRAAAEAIARRGGTRAVLGAQTHAIGFYERLGFAAFGPEYMDAGIPHRDMERRVP
jgi:predicted GNAT family N-acyltransferase